MNYTNLPDYDPPEIDPEPDCEYCEGPGVVAVATILCADDVERPWPMLNPESEVPEVPCPWCQG